MFSAGRGDAHQQAEMLRKTVVECPFTKQKGGKKLSTFVLQSSRLPLFMYQLRVLLDNCWSRVGILGRFLRSDEPAQKIWRAMKDNFNAIRLATLVERAIHEAYDPSSRLGWICGPAAHKPVFHRFLAKVLFNLGNTRPVMTEHQWGLLVNEATVSTDTFILSLSDRGRRADYDKACEVCSSCGAEGHKDEDVTASASASGKRKASNTPKGEAKKPKAQDSSFRKGGKSA